MQRKTVNMHYKIARLMIFFLWFTVKFCYQLLSYVDEGDEFLDNKRVDDIFPPWFMREQTSFHFSISLNCIFANIKAQEMVLVTANLKNVETDTTDSNGFIYSEFDDRHVVVRTCWANLAATMTTEKL